VGEYGLDDIAREPEFAVADAIIQLSSVMSREREVRVLQVLKLRGSGFLSGQHAYRLSERGVDVFPRLADVGDASDYPLHERRISSGIPALDTMLGDGSWPGACTLVAGPSGSGKTVMVLSFIFGGAALGGGASSPTCRRTPASSNAPPGGSAGRWTTPPSRCSTARRSTSTWASGPTRCWRRPRPVG